jgi:hypothetical protein
MAINNKNSAAKSASKKINFFNCNGCFGRFPIGSGFQAPKNKYNFHVLCKSCYKQYISKTVTPLPAGAAPILKDKFGGLLTSGGAGIISTAGAGILSNANAGILSNANGGLISNAVPTGGGHLISNQTGFMGMNSGTLIGIDHATLISESGSTFNKSSKLISESGSTLIGKIR